MIKKIEECKIIYPNYFKNNNVYKSCNKKWVIVLEKIIGMTITNESRPDIYNTNTASYRANLLKVVLIFNKFNLNHTISEVTHFYNKNKINYKVGEIIKSDFFDTNIYEVNTFGIHYFKSVECAFYYELINLDEILYWIHYDCTGRKMSEGEYLNEKKHGKWIFYNLHCKKYIECFYLNNKLHGEYKTFNNKGLLLLYQEYYNGCLNGDYIRYYNNCKIFEKGKFENNMRTGIWTIFLKNGSKFSEGTFTKDYRNNDWINF